jgi:hypothetical protein
MCVLLSWSNSPVPIDHGQIILELVLQKAKEAVAHQQRDSPQKSKVPCLKRVTSSSVLSLAGSLLITP